MRRTLLSVATAVAMMTMLAGPAAAQYPPLPEDAVDASVSDNTLVPGEAFMVTGDDWLPGSTVTFTLFSKPMALGSAVVDDDTTFSAELEIPESTEPGIHTLQIAGTSDDDQPRVVELTLEVLGAGAAGAFANEGDLASTGTDLTVGLGLAGTLLIAGALTLIVARRRRSRVVIGS